MDAVNRRLGISIVDQPSVGNPLEFCSSGRNKNSSCVLYLFYAGDWIRFFGFGEIFFFFFRRFFWQIIHFLFYIRLKIAEVVIATRREI